MKTEKKDILSGTIKTPKRKKLMGRFDNDKPFQISTILDDGEFVLRLKDNKFIFKNNDKFFEIYIEIIHYMTLWHNYNKIKFFMIVIL